MESKIADNAPGIAAGLFLLGSKSFVCSIKTIATDEPSC